MHPYLLRLRPASWMFLLGFLGCQVPGNSERVEITGSLAPSSTCDYSATNSPVSKGFYDPSVDGGSGYILALGLRNNMQAAAADTVSMGEVSNITNVSHDIVVTGAEGCWYLADSDAKALNGRKDVVDCTTLPEQSGTFELSSFVGEGAASGAVVLHTLTLDHLKSLFGSNFSPKNIPPRGIFASPDPADNPSVAGLAQSTPTLYRYSFGQPQMTELSTRDPAWGNFPAADHATVILQLRLKAQLENHAAFLTDYFSFPIDVCPRCLQGVCGELVQKTCAKGPCSDGTPCLAGGTCANTSLTCSALTMFSGAKVDYSGATCLPAQNFAGAGAPSCVAVGCDASSG